jgi:YD repeat-containing protein
MPARSVVVALPGDIAHRITVDARLIGSGGIGTYIEEMLPRVIAALPSAHFTLLGDAAALHSLVPPSPRVELREFTSRIYSIREQVAFPAAIPSDTALFWAPHYNVPLAWHGPLAVTIHDVGHLTLPQGSLVKRLYARGMFAAVRRRAAIVFCVSEWTASEIERQVGTLRRVTVTQNGVAPRWLRATDSPSTERSPYFLYVGSIKPHKNLERLLDAYAAVAGQLPHRLIIAGPSDGLRTVDSSVLERVTTFGDRVEYKGRLSQAGLEQLVRGCDGLVLPSIHEGFGLPPVEALAAGRPVAVSQIASLQEVCGPMAEYFDPLDVESIAGALVRLARRQPDSPQTVENRRAWARQFDWDAAARLTSDGLRQALAD